MNKEKIKQTFTRYRTHIGASVLALALGLGIGHGCSEDPQCYQPSPKPKVTATENPLPRAAPTRKTTLAPGPGSLPNPIQGYLCEVIADTKSVPVASEKPLTLTPMNPGRKAKRDHDGKKNSFENNVLEAYFATNSWKCYKNDITDVAKLAKQLAPGTTVIVEGNADHRGSEKWNDELGTHRAQGIEGILLRNNPTLKIQTTSYGEEKATRTDKKDLYLDRKVSIIPNRSVVKQALDKLPADVYLVDQSHSMINPTPAGTSRWEEIQNYSFPKGKKVYTFSDTSRTCGTKLSGEKPVGGTPMYDSLSELINLTPFGKTITILTDGEDSSSRYATADKVVSQATAKNISINVVDLSGVPQNSALGIATQTGGKTYRISK